MDISVIGTGYVGLVSGVCLAEKGHHVICVDIDQNKVNQINEGISPIFENGLEELLKKNINKTIEATTDLEKAVLNTDISLIAVGTPFDGERIDLRYIETVSRQIAKAMQKKPDYHMVVVKSTVIPGTTNGIVLPILEDISGKRCGDDFGVGMNPEFLREGEAVEDFMFPDRIVMGASEEKGFDLLETLYHPFKHTDKVRTNVKTAEMIKYASNSLLATMISFSNEIGNLCRAVGDVDVVEVMKGVHLDKRLCPIMPDGERIVPSFTKYIEAGCGFGGSCFPKDVKALLVHGKEAGTPMHMLDAVIRVNEEQPRQVLSLLRKHYDSLKGIPVAVLGLAFKPGTDDVRESPAIPIIKSLLDEGAQVKAYDPIAKDAASQIFGDTPIIYTDSLRETIEGVQAILLLTRWKEFEQLEDLVNQLEPSPLVVDGRRMLNSDKIPRYEGIGR